MFRVAAGVAYTQLNDNDSSGCANPGATTSTANDCHIWTVGASIMHTPTGLYVTATGAQLTDGQRRAAYFGGPAYTTATRAMADAGLVDNEESWWYIQAGWEAKLNSLGKTTFWGDYFDASVGSNIRSSGNAIRTVAAGDVLNSFAAANTLIQHADITMWGFGVTQDIDAAAMKLYLGYKNASGDLTLYNSTTNSTRKSNSIEDIQVIYTGATIKF
jgi:hypothetical protein